MNSKKLNANALPIAGVFAVGLAIVAACSSGTTTTVPVEAGVNCGDGSQVCGTTCTVLARDAENCGACGKKCGAGEVCSQGACAASCGGGTTKCGTACADTKTDGSNCGTCGTKCGAGQVCNAGVCANGCGAGSTVCGNSCVNTQTDQVNCGSCGTLCAGGEQCVAGKCQISCQAGLTLCTPPQVDGGVSDAASDVSVVDASNDAGPVLGTTYCANLKTDNANCGGCGIQCGAGTMCANGACSTTCGAPNTLCTSDAGPPVCANLQSDVKNCGTCGKACPNGFACFNGTCTAAQKCSDVATALCLAKGGSFAVRSWSTSFPNQPGGSLYCTTSTASADCDTCNTYQQYVWKATAVDACNSGQAMAPGSIYGGHNPCTCAPNKPLCGTWAMNGCIPD